MTFYGRIRNRNRIRKIWPDPGKRSRSDRIRNTAGEATEMDDRLREVRCGTWNTWQVEGSQVRHQKCMTGWGRLGAAPEIHDRLREVRCGTWNTWQVEGGEVRHLKYMTCRVRSDAALQGCRSRPFLHSQLRLQANFGSVSYTYSLYKYQGMKVDN